MTIDTDKTLELLHNSPCGFSYNTNPSRYTIEQKELVKFVNFIYSKAIKDCSVITSEFIRCQECPINCNWGTEESCAEDLKNYFMEQINDNENIR